MCQPALLQSLAAVDQPLSESLRVGVGVRPTPALRSLDADLDEPTADVEVGEPLDPALVPARLRSCDATIT